MKTTPLADTRQLGFAALAVAALGWGFDAMTGPLWGHWGLRADLLEMIGTGLFWISYVAIWLLLPISAFRPASHFYLRGDCKFRLRAFGTISGLLIGLHILILIGFLHACRGGFVGGA